MVTGDVVGDLNDVISVLPPEVWGKVEGLILILKAVGIVAIIYFVYIIMMGVLSFKRTRRIKSIEEKIILIDEKLNKLLKKKK